MSRSVHRPRESRLVARVQEDGTAMPAIDKLKNAIMNETLEAHYKLDKRLEAYLEHADLANELCKETVVKEVLKHRIATYFFVVTGYHRHVGFVGDYYSDPSLASMSWKSGEPFGRPRQHMIMSVVNVFTSMQQPLLKEDYTHLFKGTDHEAELTKAWKNFQGYLQEVEEEIDRRNEKRRIKNINMSPKVVESAVSK
ncbi:unnamed protein product [Effrenium voratum]|uniref:Uncharacterized protein n=1 Tax=Effrenium voratum TaxID=2562239 RepID=A0AA36NA97_9DINO|nr:unnamed protein product [Effrenium voratum]